MHYKSCHRHSEGFECVQNLTTDLTNALSMLEILPQYYQVFKCATHLATNIMKVLNASEIFPQMS